MEALTNNDLEDISQKYQLNLTISSQQDLAKLKTLPTNNFIVLIDEGDGSGHWIAFIIKSKVAYYFDSFACRPSNYILNYLKRMKIKKIIVSSNDIQQIDDTSCGWYCLTFLKYMMNKPNLDKALYDYTHLFYNDTNKNLLTLQKLIAQYF